MDQWTEIKRQEAMGCMHFYLKGNWIKMKGMLFLVHKVLLLFKFESSHLPKTLKTNLWCIA